MNEIMLIFIFIALGVSLIISINICDQQSKLIKEMLEDIKKFERELLHILEIFERQRNEDNSNSKS